MSETSFPTFQLLGVFALTVVLTIGIRKIVKADWLYPKVRRYLNLCIPLVWLLVIGGVVYQTGRHAPRFLWVEIGIVGFFVFGARDWIRQLVSGMILVFENRFSRGELIHLNDLRGRITRFHLRHLTIEMPSGEYTDVPYSHLIDHPVGHIGSSAQANFEFELEVPADLTVEQSIARAREAIHLSPLMAPHKAPEIFVEKRQKGHSIVVRSRAFDADSVSQLSSDVTARFEDLIDQ